MKVEANLDDAYKLLKKRGLEPSGKVQQMFTTTVARELDAYVPFQTGALKNTRIIGTDTITYNTPYARFLYHGKVMVGEKSRSAFANKGERKVVTDKDLTYNGAPKRGAYWDKRMWADKKDKIISEIAKEAGGRTE